MGLFKRIIRILSHWKIHAHNIYMQTIVRLRVIEEMKKKNLSKEMKHLVQFKRMPFFPYDFPHKYRTDEVEIYFDGEGFPYVQHKEKRLFMKRGWSVQRCREYYVSLLAEQDDESPHKYLSNAARMPQKEDIVADVGAAEGIFTLEIIESVGKAYLFEGDAEWKIPLEKTFAEWKDKIALIDKYVDSGDGCDVVCFDTFFKNKNVTYVKADIEGWEEKLLAGGAEHVLP